MIEKIQTDLDPVHTILAEFENGMKFLRLGVAFTRCRYEIACVTDAAVPEMPGQSSCIQPDYNFRTDYNVG